MAGDYRGDVDAGEGGFGGVEDLGFFDDHVAEAEGIGHFSFIFFFMMSTFESLDVESL